MTGTSVSITEQICALHYDGPATPERDAISSITEDVQFHPEPTGPTFPAWYPGMYLCTEA